jgi:hypothetical protein
MEKRLCAGGRAEAVLSWLCYQWLWKSHSLKPGRMASAHVYQVLNVLGTALLP